jgi:hypothetical protein
VLKKTPESFFKGEHIEDIFSKLSFALLVLIVILFIASLFTASISLPITFGNEAPIVLETQPILVKAFLLSFFSEVGLLLIV